MQQAKTDLFSTFYKGDKGIEKLTEDGILIIGLTKMGKSTISNLLLDRPMIGSVDPQFAHKTIYLPNKDINNSAKTYAPMGSNYESLTLYPNIQFIGNKCWLIDMAGFQENRNQIGVMAVSYFLISVFQKLKRVKFIMVTTEEVLFSSNIKQFCRAFEELFSLFSFNMLNADFKKMFMSSVSLVISCAKQPQKYYRQFLPKLAKRLGKEALEMIGNKDLIIQMLETISEQNHIDVFELAQVGVVTIKSNILNRLQKDNWKFFDIQKAQKQLKKQILVVPFNRDYESLKEDQKYKITVMIESRVKAFIQVNTIFSTYLSYLRLNWSAGIKKSIKISQVFTKIAAFLAANYPYGSEIKFEEAKLIPNNSQQDIFNIVVKSLELYDLNVELQREIMDDWESMSFGEKMQKYSLYFSQMIDRLVPSCTETWQHEQLLKLKFLLSRGFSEFPKLYLLKHNLINSMARELIDENTFAITSSMDKQRHFEYFVNGINRECLVNNFRNLQDLSKFEELLSKYQSTFKNELKSKQNYVRRIKINGLKIEIKNVMVDLLVSGQYSKWLRIQKQCQLAGSYCDQIVLMANNNFYKVNSPQPNEKTERIMAESIKLGPNDKQKNRINLMKQSASQLQIRNGVTLPNTQQSNNARQTPKRVPNYKQVQTKLKMNNYISEQPSKKNVQQPFQRKEFIPIIPQIRLENSQQLDFNFEEMNFKLIATIYSICECLLLFNNIQLPNGRTLAFKLSKMIKDVHMSNQIFRMLLDYETESGKLIELLDSYIDFCCYWGKNETAMQMLHRKRHIFLKEKNMVKYRETNTELSQLFDRFNRCQRQLKPRLEDIGKMLNAAELENVKELLARINQDVARQKKKVNFEEKPPSMILKSVS